MLSSAVNRARAARRNQESGFTLIELLIVIVILGVLAGIVVFSVAGITNKGDSAACKATITSIDVAAEAAIAQGAAATNVSDLSAYFHAGKVPTSVKTKGGTTKTLTTVALADAIDCDS